MSAAVTGAVLSTNIAPRPVHAQAGAPITVTPPNLRPEQHNNVQIEIPEAGALTPPRGAEQLSVRLGGVNVEGAFPEVVTATKSIVRQIEGRQITLGEIYAAASAIEAAHARAGYVLARVSVPPQSLANGATLRILVTDGFIEAIDVAGVPRAARDAVYARAKGLQNRHHLRLADIEQPLLIANDVPGLTLRSTLMRGSRPGGTRLVLEGSHRLITTSLGASNGYDPSLGTYGVHAEISLNSPFGHGEQFYGFVASGYEIDRLFASDAKVRVLGGGAVLPFAAGRLTINPEVTFSRTHPTPALGAPQTLGELRRLTLRSNYTLTRTRRTQAGASITLEQIDEKNSAPDFAFVVSHDRYMVARLGLSWSKLSPSGETYGVGAQVSQGLGNFGAISFQRAVAQDTPFSRVGSGTNFTHVNLHTSATLPVTAAVELAAEAKAQTTFGRPVFRSEQFSLEGPDGLSAYVGGASAVDEGVAGRAELRFRPRVKVGSTPLDIRPYLFGATGAGRIDEPTFLEPSSIKAANLGAGARATVASGRIELAVEYGHGFSDYLPLKNTDRVTASLEVRL